MRLSLGIVTWALVVVSPARAQSADTCAAVQEHTGTVHFPVPKMAWLEEEPAILEEIKIVVRRGMYTAMEECNASGNAICGFQAKVAIPPDLADMWMRDSAKTEWGLSQIIVWDPNATEAEQARAAEYYRSLGGGAARILGFIHLLSSPTRMLLSFQAIERLQRPVESQWMIEYICDVTWVLRTLQARDTSLLAYAMGHVLLTQSFTLPEAYRLLSPADRRVIRPAIESATRFHRYDLDELDGLHDQ